MSQESNDDRTKNLQSEILFLKRTLLAISGYSKKKLAEKDEELAQKDEQLAEKNKKLAQKDNHISHLVEDLEDKKIMLKLRACFSDCVTVCLVWIYWTILKITPCNHHLLEKILSIYKKESGDYIWHSRTDLLDWLYELNIIDKQEDFDYSEKSVCVDDVWDFIMRMDYDKLKLNWIILLGRIPKNETDFSHCVACNLKTRCADKIQICDPQKSSVPRTMTLEEFKKYVEDDKGMHVCQIDFKMLLKIEDEDGCNETNNVELLNDDEYEVFKIEKAFNPWRPIEQIKELSSFRRASDGV